MERKIDAHIYLLDASSAFDKISWQRIRGQLIKRKIPFCLVKLVFFQLVANRICISYTNIIYPTTGVKQGGVLSGKIFSICYDDRYYLLEQTGAGNLFPVPNGKCILIRVLIYADDIILMARTHNGLKYLIKITLPFVDIYGSSI